MRHIPNTAPNPISDPFPKDSPSSEFILSASYPRDTPSRDPSELVSQRRPGIHRRDPVQFNFDKATWIHHGQGGVFQDYL